MLPLSVFLRFVVSVLAVTVTACANDTANSADEQTEALHFRRLPDSSIGHGEFSPTSSTVIRCWPANAEHDCLRVEGGGGLYTAVRYQTKRPDSFPLTNAAGYSCIIVTEFPGVYTEYLERRRTAREVQEEQRALEAQRKSGVWQDISVENLEGGVTVLLKNLVSGDPRSSPRWWGRGEVVDFMRANRVHNDMNYFPCAYVVAVMNKGSLSTLLTTEFAHDAFGSPGPNPTSIDAAR